MSRRYVLTFQPRFAELVASGVKRQTIRALRKDCQIEAGDVLSLRAWLGRPRASGQRLLRPECPCVASSAVTINECGMSIDGDLRDLAERNLIARADGFDDFERMLDWFRETHGLPFSGRLIQW